MTFKAATRSEEQTRRLAARLGREAKPGDVLCLFGPLGGGKTAFVKGFAEAAGCKGSVISPTFAVAREYAARGLRLHHLDLFRLAPADLANLGLEEYFEDPKGVCLIEWPEIARGWLPKDRVEIAFVHRKGGGRGLRFKSLGRRSGELVSLLKS